MLSSLVCNVDSTIALNVDYILLYIKTVEVQFYNVFVSLSCHFVKIRNTFVNIGGCGASVWLNNANNLSFICD